MTVLLSTITINLSHASAKRGSMDQTNIKNMNSSMTKNTSSKFLSRRGVNDKSGLANYSKNIDRTPTP